MVQESAAIVGVLVAVARFSVATRQQRTTTHDGHPRVALSDLAAPLLGTDATLWHPHELRHTAASRMSEAGVPIETIADRLGHDGTRMALLIYRHATKPAVSAGNAMIQHLTS